MAKRRRKHKKSRKGGSQRAKFKAAAHKCAAKVRGEGHPAFSRASWQSYGKCMKSSL